MLVTWRASTRNGCSTPRNVRPKATRHQYFHENAATMASTRRRSHGYTAVRHSEDEVDREPRAGNRLTAASCQRSPRKERPAVVAVMSCFVGIHHCIVCGECVHAELPVGALRFVLAQTSDQPSYLFVSRPISRTACVELVLWLATVRHHPTATDQ